MRYSLWGACLCLLTVLILPAADTWTFAVSGDSRNCGDVIMPAIAAGVASHDAAFYWHLGDFRSIFDFDQDYKQIHPTPLPTISGYLNGAWPDFIQNQIVPFGGMPFYVGIGNHELIPPKTRDDFIVQFADWLDTPILRDQRLADDPSDHILKTWYHWIVKGVDFINLDNASPDQFSPSQLQWAESILDRDASNAAIQAVVVGMHQALPDSIAFVHSMNDSLVARASGRELYDRLVAYRQKTQKPVYILASHSHFYLENAFNTRSKRQSGTVLPGWIIGTAGAVRYPLPQDLDGAGTSATNVYGYFLAVVRDAKIEFNFQRLSETDIPPGVENRFTAAFVHECFIGNTQAP